MGSHHSHDSKSGGEGNASGTSTPRGSQRGTGSRSGSGGDLQGLPERQDKPPPSMVPVEKLGKLLAQRSQKEDGVNGVTEKSFTKYLFPMYPELARQFYKYIHRVGKCKNQHIPLATFRLHCEKILSMLDDAVIIDTYVRMFGAETDDNAVMPDGLRQLLYTSYKLSMDHYPEGPQTCLMINKTLTAVVNSCFNKKDCHSVGFVVRWLEEHCHRLIFPVHRGPTMVLVQGDGVLVVVCCPSEWRETHQYWGTQDSALLQIFPTFSVVERAPKMLYLNTSIRGYPKGLRAGSDPRKPLLAVAEDFDSFTFKGVPYSLQAIEVWGCGDQASRETQLEIKKWQVREAERQRQVKLSAADWIEHPDRYLLELAGRPQYNNSST